MPSCHLLQVFRTCTANGRSIWRLLKDDESNRHLLTIYLHLGLNKNLKQQLATDIDPRCPLMDFVLSLYGQMSSSTFPPHFYSFCPKGLAPLFITSLLSSAVTHSELNVFCTNSHWLSLKNQLHMGKEGFLFLFFFSSKQL